MLNVAKDIADVQIAPSILMESDTMYVQFVLSKQSSIDTGHVGTKFS